MNEDAMRAELIDRARKIRRQAYAPYSHYQVGAALLTKSGKIYEGVNIENAAFPVTICAERVAVFKAVSEGEREFAAIAVVTRDGGSPCGSCRQVLAEFSLEMCVYLADENGVLKHELSLRELLPLVFTPASLES